ncbi:MAG TPA: hypothetical protein VJS64_12120 [Pyrinomonadaceae bacterium]|nr:hypothetical protein [Pyrinomonadaceae bacterium]
MAHLTVATSSRIKRIIAVVFVTILIYCSFDYFANDQKTAQAAQAGAFSAYQQLLDLSQKEKKGLTFFVEGQTIPGIVVKVIGNEAVEVRNQTHSRVIIRLESVDAVAMN